MNKYDIAYLKSAIAFSETSAAKRLQVGCVFVKGKNIVSWGVNGTPPKYPTNDCEDESGNTLDCVLHAEDNAILKAAEEGVSLKDSIVYLTHSPCLKCAIKLKSVGVKRVVYISDYRENSGLKYLSTGANIVSVNKVNI